MVFDEETKNRIVRTKELQSIAKMDYFENMKFYNAFSIMLSS